MFFQSTQQVSYGLQNLIKGKIQCYSSFFCQACGVGGFNLTLLCFFAYSWESDGCITFNSTLPLWLGIPILYQHGGAGNLAPVWVICKLPQLSPACGPMGAASNV